MAKALRHHFAARRAGKQFETPKEYEVIDPQARVDHAGHFAGVPAKKINGKLVVSLKDKEAKFYLMQGSIRLRAN